MSSIVETTTQLSSPVATTSSLISTTSAKPKRFTGSMPADQLYTLIMSQLAYDGYQQVATQLASTLQVSPVCQPSDRLFKLITAALQQEDDAMIDNDTANINAGLDFDFVATRAQSTADEEKYGNEGPPEGAKYETCYVTAHKAACRTAAFDLCGSVIATGSDDASIKILDVDRLLAKSCLPAAEMQESMQAVENHPVVRTLYDHTEEITHLEFHPRDPLLISGSKDCTVKFFEFTKSSARRSCRCINESHPIRSLSVHPTGEWLLVTTDHPVIRLYRVETSQAYVSARPLDQHTSSVSSIAWSPNARLFVSAGKDGAIKLWDAVSCRCINTIVDAHSKEEVCSISFSKNSKYLLSSGKDSVVKLWELSSCRCLLSYTGAGSVGKQQHRNRATFTHTEDYVFFPDERTISLCCWDTRTAERKQLLSLGHNNVVKCIVHSPVYPAFISCSDDFRARFWCKKPNEA